MPPLPDAGPVAPPPPALPEEQPGVRTQGRSLFGRVFVSVKQPGSGPEYPKRHNPVAVLPSPLGYCPRVSCAMDRWLP